MPWSRIDSGFWRHPKFDGWTPADKWAFGELMGYCAEYRTEGKIPKDLALLPRGITPRFLRQAEASGWLDRDENNTLKIHDWTTYHPADNTAAERNKRYRERNEHRNQTRNGNRNDPVTNTRNETVPRAQADAPVTNTNTLNTPPTPPQRGDAWEETNGEESRVAAWWVAAQTTPGVRNVAGFATAGIRSGGWPQPQERNDARPVNMPPSDAASYIAGLIRNGVIAERFELDDEIQRAGLEPADAGPLVAQFDLARQLNNGGAA